MSASSNTPSHMQPISDDEDDVPQAGPSNVNRNRENGGDVSMQSVDNNDDDEANDNARAPYVDSESDSDPDDPVIRSLPVYLTPALSKSLALLQYPHRPPAFHTRHPLLPPSLRPEPSLEDARPASERVTARYKPKVGQLELSVPLEVRQGKAKQRFNADRSTELGRGQQESDLGERGTRKAVNGSGGANGRDQDASNEYEAGSGKALERMTMAGEAVPDQTWYTCAVLKDDEVHLTPLTRTLQMRAHLSYLDRIDALGAANSRRERMAAGTAGSEDEALSAGSDEDDGATQSASALKAAKAKKAAAAEKKAKAGENRAVQIKMSEAPEQATSGAPGKKGDAKTSRAAASLFGPAKAAQEEAWIDLPFYDPTTSEADRIYEKLFATRADKLEMLTKATQYLKL